MARSGSEDGAVYRKIVPASRRYGVMDRKTLKKGLKDLKDVQEKLEGLLEEMTALGLPRIEMDGVTKMERGADLMSSFLVKLDQAIARAR